tara:strand:- start:4730 stop:5728 length:999 start_codon:yes stop_codon:yes gene_type:complete
MKIIKFFILFILIFSFNSSHSIDKSFDIWKKDFKVYAIDQGISSNTINYVINKFKYLPNVIKYDRYQPEFYEDTFTYIKKRTSEKKILNGKKLYIQNNEIINKIAKKYSIDKNLLLALMGIETNFGTYLGKMDIISSLATLSFDKRRSQFFTSELISLLKLIDLKIVNPDILFGSWAGAYGNFQFMPSTITKYAIDYNNDNKIDLKSIEDSFASAANYLNKLGWNNEMPCYYKIELIEKIPLKYLNTSAKNIKNKKKVKLFKKYIKNSEFLDNFDKLNSAIVTPDVDIVNESNKFEPAYIVFNNYELILKWNRSLRFAFAVCTLKEKFKNEL